MLVSLGIALLQVVVFVWDFFTIFIYFVIQTPWKIQKEKDSTRAKVISKLENEVTYRPVPKKCAVKTELQSSNITTMAGLFDVCVRKHKKRRCLGTRQILGEREEQQPNGKVFTKLDLGGYEWQSYVDVDERAEQLGRGLRELGINPGDKIVLYANTCADWMTTATACFKNSIAIVTIYTNLGEEGVTHGITQTSARLVVASQELVPRLVKVLPSASFVNKVVIIPNHKQQPKPEVQNVDFHTIDDVVLLGKSSSTSTSPPDPEDTAIIMYTSGSTGVPKGVVLTHKNILQALYCMLPTAAESIGTPTENSAYMAYLPLAHILELLAENVMIALGVPVGYGNTNTLLDTSTMVGEGSKGDVTMLCPTAMCAVPLVLDRIFKGLQAGVKKKGPFVSALIDFCYNYRLTWTKRGYQTPIMDRFILKSLRQIVGGRLELLLSGGAPLAPDAHDYCRTVLGITLLQGYGLTETASTATIMDKYDFSTGLVGPPLDEVDIKLINWEEGGYTVNDPDGPRGEVIIGGNHVAKEYYNMPDKTQEEFFDQDGIRWFRTGDIGHFQKNGTLKIIDRKKDLVKLQGGEYVSLGKVESILKIHAITENVCIYADPSRSHTVALLVPDQPALASIAAKNNRDGMEREQMCADQAIVSQILQMLQKHGSSQKLAKFEIPQALYLVSEPWTPESGLVTAAMKLKRKAIESQFKEVIAELYSPGSNKSMPKVAPAATAVPSGQTAAPSSQPAPPSGQPAPPSGQTAAPSGQTPAPSGQTDHVVVDIANSNTGAVQNDNPKESTATDTESKDTIAERKDETEESKDPTTESKDTSAESKESTTENKDTTAENKD